jgi:hypothetical protein
MVVMAPAPLLMKRANLWPQNSSEALTSCRSTCRTYAERMSGATVPMWQQPPHCDATDASSQHAAARSVPAVYHQFSTQAPVNRSRTLLALRWLFGCPGAAIKAAELGATQHSREFASSLHLAAVCAGTKP